MLVAGDTYRDHWRKARDECRPYDGRFRILTLTGRRQTGWNRQQKRFNTEDISPDGRSHLRSGVRTAGASSAELELARDAGNFTLEGTYDQLGPGEISSTLTRQTAGCGGDEQIHVSDYDLEIETVVG
jgi:hypothetical protein